MPRCVPCSAEAEGKPSLTSSSVRRQNLKVASVSQQADWWTHAAMDKFRQLAIGENPERPELLVAGNEWQWTWKR
jgi:hypothetical protein